MRENKKLDMPARYRSILTRQGTVFHPKLKLVCLNEWIFHWSFNTLYPRNSKGSPSQKITSCKHSDLFLMLFWNNTMNYDSLHEHEYLVLLEHFVKLKMLIFKYYTYSIYNLSLIIENAWMILFSLNGNLRCSLNAVTLASILSMSGWMFKMMHY